MAIGEIITNIRGGEGDSYRNARIVGDDLLLDHVRKNVVTGAETISPQNAGRARGERGYSNPDTVPTVQFLGEQANATDSPLFAGIAKNFLGKDTLVYNVRDHGVVGNGVANDTATVQALIDKAPRGATIWAPPGTVLRTNGWVISGKSVKIDFEAATVVQLLATPIFDVTGEWGTVHAVNTAVEGTVTLANASSYAVGDLVKVYSDDVNIHGRPGGEGLAPKLGQFTFVTAIDGNNLTVVPKLLDAYSTRIKIAKLEEHYVSIKVGDSYSLGSAGRMYQLESLAFADLKIKVSRGNGAAVRLYSCFGVRTDLNVSNLPRGTGYGLTSWSSAYGDHTIYANRLRHSYTDDTYTLQPEVGSGAPQDYGYAMFDTIRGKAIDTLESAWDTHHGGLGHKFIGCVSYGTENGAAGFTFRGRNHEFINCTAAYTSSGFRIFDEQDKPWATSTGHLLSNCRAIGTHNAVVGSLKTGLTAEDGPNMTIDGGIFESRTGTLLTAANTRILLNNPLFRFVGTTTPTAPAYGMLIGPSEVTGSARIEIDQLTSGSYAALIYGSSTTEAQKQMADLELKVKLSEYAAANMPRLVWANTLQGQIDLRLNRTISGVNATHLLQPPAMFSVTRSTIGTDDVRGESSFSVREIPMNYYLNVENRGDPYITFECLQPVTASRILGGVTRGAHSGQVVNIYNSPNSLGPLRLATTGGTITQNVSLPATIDIAQGTGIQLVWNGEAGSWRYVSRS